MNKFLKIGDCELIGKMLSFSRLSCLAARGQNINFRCGKTASQPAPFPCRQLSGERVFCYQESAGCGTSQPHPRAKGRGESQSSFDLGSLNPALETLAGLALKVPFLHRLESSIRMPRDSIKAADQNHRFTGYTGESRLFGLQGLLPAVAPCLGDPQSLLSQPSRSKGTSRPTAGGDEALRFSARWRNRNRSGPQLTDSHPTSERHHLRKLLITN